MRIALLALGLVASALLPTRDAVAQDQPGKVAVVDSRSVVIAVQGLG